jgi:hypothetical protein
MAAILLRRRGAHGEPMVIRGHDPFGYLHTLSFGRVVGVFPARSKLEI